MLRHSLKPRVFRIQYASDLHLEHYTKVYPHKLVKPVAPYLALAGDIGHPSSHLWRPFFEYANRNWDHVFYVPGTKEYSLAESFKKQHRKIKESLAEFQNISLLDETAPSFYFQKQNVAIVGSTLWSKQNDEHYINALHTLDKARIEKHIDFWTYQKATIVVLTHHIPSYRLIKQPFQNHPAAYASSCESLMTPQVRAWIYGRTHTASQVMIRNTLAAVNSRGYPSEQVPGFSNQAVVEIEGADSGGEGADMELTVAATHTFN